jgi:hypothetical protein
MLEQPKAIIGVAMHGRTEDILAQFRALGAVNDHVLAFLKRNHGRKLREVMDTEIDISDVIH